MQTSINIVPLAREMTMRELRREIRRRIAFNKELIGEHGGDCRKFPNISARISAYENILLLTYREVTIVTRKTA